MKKLVYLIVSCSPFLRTLKEFVTTLKHSLLITLSDEPVFLEMILQTYNDNHMRTLSEEVRKMCHWESSFMF